jgi:hypothetical protein
MSTNKDIDQEQLVKTIKAHIERGDQAQDKAEQHYIAAGQHLKALREGKNQKTFLAMVQERIGVGKTRTYELIAIADKTKTLRQVRADTAKRVADTKARVKLSATSGQTGVVDSETSAVTMGPAPIIITTNNIDPADSAEAMKAKFAEADGDAPKPVEIKIEPEPAKKSVDYAVQFGPPHPWEFIFEIWQAVNIEQRRTFLWRVGEQDLRKVLPDTIRAAWETHFRRNAGLHEAKKVRRAKKSNLTAKQLEAKQRDERARQIGKITRTQPPRSARIGSQHG